MNSNCRQKSSLLRLDALSPQAVFYKKENFSDWSLWTTLYFRNVEAEKTYAVSLVTFLLSREVVMTCPEVCSNGF